MLAIFADINEGDRVEVQFALGSGVQWLSHGDPAIMI
jgi:hypothetical protein